MPTQCKESQILRSAFTRKGKRVAATCIRRVSPYPERYSAFQKRIISKMVRRLRGITKANRGNTIKCGSGFILRKAYVRFLKADDGTIKKKLVRGACITRRGSSNSGIKIGPIRKGELSQYGYSSIKTLSVIQRRNALKKAVESLGSLSVWRKVNLLYVYNKNKNKQVAAAFNADRNWIKTLYGLKAP